MAYQGQINPWGTYGVQPVQTSQAQPVNGLVRVTGIEGAKAYQMPPNSSMPLFDGNEDILYVKTTDGAGFPTVRAFRFEPIDEQPSNQAEYVTREEFDKFARSVEEAVHGFKPVPESGE